MTSVSQSSLCNSMENRSLASDFSCSPKSAVSQSFLYPGSTVAVALSKRNRQSPMFVKRSRFMLSEYENLQKFAAKRYMEEVGDIKNLAEVILGSPDSEHTGDCARLNKYQFIAPVASGASGVVFKARSTESIVENEFVAIKLVAVQDSRQRQACIKEADIQGRLNHRNIVRLIDFVITEKYAVFVQEWVPRTLLSVVLNNERTISEGIVREGIAQITASLCYIHANSVIHGDVKLDNILVSDDGTMKLCDFGSSRYITSVRSSSKRSRSSSSGFFPGTPLYCSPESIITGELSPETDMWSLGVIAYILLSGYAPFSFGGDELKDQIMTARFTFHKRLWAQISPAARDFVSNLLRKNMIKRLSAAEAVNHRWIRKLEIGFKKKSVAAVGPEKIPVLSTSIYVGLKVRSLSLLKNRPEEFLAKKAFALFERYIEEMTKTYSYFCQYLHIGANLTRSQTKVLPKPADNPQMPTSGESLGESKWATEWIGDSEVAFCKLCDKEFDLFTRRHHCRRCGQVICSSCSKHRCEGNKVCDLCFATDKN